MTAVRQVNLRSRDGLSPLAQLVNFYQRTLDRPQIQKFVVYLLSQGALADTLTGRGREDELPVR